MRLFSVQIFFNGTSVYSLKSFTNRNELNLKNERKLWLDLVTLFNGIPGLVGYLGNLTRGTHPLSESTCGVIAKVLECGPEENEFNPQLCYYANFWTNTLGKGMNFLILPGIS